MSVWKLALEKNRGNRVIIYAICSISLLAMIGTKSSTSTIATIVAIVEVDDFVPIIAKREIEQIAYIITLFPLFFSRASFHTLKIIAIKYQ